MEIWNVNPSLSCNKAERDGDQAISRPTLQESESALPVVHWPLGWPLERSMGGELISTEDLARILREPELRIFDCTTRLDYQLPGSDLPYIAVPGLDEAAHIPGADFLDIQGEFSDQDTRLCFMMAGTAELEVAFRRHGVANDSRVILYSLGSPMWATRFWWMLESLQPRLRAQWRLRKVVGGRTRDWARGSPRGYPTGDFTAASRPGFFVDKHAVLAVRNDASVVVVNALGPQSHKGLEPSRYGRPGRIPGSVNVPAATLYDPVTKTFANLADAELEFGAQAVTKKSRSSHTAGEAFPRRLICCIFAALATKI
jgi:thiosulfate/3-mercaptopyruvate sulfurtransferase